MTTTTHDAGAKRALATMLTIAFVLATAGPAAAACIKLPLIGEVCAPKIGCVTVLGKKLCAPGLPAPKPAPKPAPGPAPKPEEPETTGSKRYKVGDCKYAGAALSYAADVNVKDEYASSKLTGKLEGCFANITKTLADAKLTNQNKRTRASLKLAGKTVYSKKLSKKGKRVKGPYIASVKMRGRLDLIPGLATAYARADIGAGAKFEMRWYRTPFPPRADLDAKARAFGHGAGELGVSAVDIGFAKLASASLRADLEFLNPEGVLESSVSLDGLDAKADVVMRGYTLYLKGKVKAACAFGKCLYDKTKTLINRSGKKRTYSLLDLG